MNAEELSIKKSIKELKDNYQESLRQFNEEEKVMLDCKLSKKSVHYQVLHTRKKLVNEFIEYLEELLK